MRHDIKETTLNADRLLGRRVFELIRADGEERITIEINCAANTSMPDERVKFEACQHPHANAGLVDPVFDLLIALREKPYAVDLTQGSES